MLNSSLLYKTNIQILFSASQTLFCAFMGQAEHMTQPPEVIPLGQLLFSHSLITSPPSSNAQDAEAAPKISIGNGFSAPAWHDEKDWKSKDLNMDSFKQAPKSL